MRMISPFLFSFTSCRITVHTHSSSRMKSWLLTPNSIPHFRIRGSSTCINRWTPDRFMCQRHLWILRSCKRPKQLLLQISVIRRSRLQAVLGRVEKRHRFRRKLRFWQLGLLESCKQQTRETFTLKTQHLERCLARRDTSASALAWPMQLALYTGPRYAYPSRTFKIPQAEPIKQDGSLNSPSPAPASFCSSSVSGGHSNSSTSAQAAAGGEV